MIPPGRPKGECRSAVHEGILIRRTRDRTCVRARACERALRLAARVLQA
jgi:hypothetical protein